MEYREHNGTFKSKQELLKVKGLGAKAYEQCAGFFRIREGKSILDNTGVHPESYAAANTLLKHYDLPTITKDQIPRIAQELGVGEVTLTDMIAELRKPGLIHGRAYLRLCFALISPISLNSKRFHHLRSCSKYC